MQNNLSSLNNYLFEALERLNDDETIRNEEGIVDPAKLEIELLRAKAISKIAAQIISNGNLVLRAKELEVGTFGKTDTPFPRMLEG